MSQKNLKEQGITAKIIYQSTKDQHNNSSSNSEIYLQVEEKDLERASKILENVIHSDNKQSSNKEPEIKKILVPVDFSDQTEWVCEYAINIAERFGSEILLMHACYIPHLDASMFNESSMYGITLDEHIESLFKNSSDQLNQLTQNIKQKLDKNNISGLSIKSLIARGFADDEIYSTYKEYDPDLIVMGNSSRTVKSHKLYGSITSETIENVLVPTIVAPTNPKVKDLKNLNRILYITNFDETDYRAIHKLIYLVSPFNLDLHVIHMNDGLIGFTNTINAEHLKDKIKEEFIGFDIRVNIISAPHELEQLNTYIEDHKIDIVSMVTHKRNYLSRLFKSSLTEKLLFNSTRPFLIFH